METKTEVPKTLKDAKAAGYRESWLGRVNVPGRELVIKGHKLWREQDTLITISRTQAVSRGFSLDKVLPVSRGFLFQSCYDLYLLADLDSGATVEERAAAEIVHKSVYGTRLDRAQMELEYRAKAAVSGMRDPKRIAEWVEKQIDQMMALQ